MSSGSVGIRQLSSHAFLRPVMAGTVNWGWVFAWLAQESMG